jgi:hypothetical protein
MRETNLTLPELGLIAGTRAMLGAGIALLLSDWLQANERHALGWALVAVGIATTIPLAAEVLGKSHCARAESDGHMPRAEFAYAG